MVAKLLGPVCKIIRIHADTVPAHKARAEVQEIPFRPRRFQHGLCVNPHPVENDGELVHKGNVNIPLGVFDHLGRFRHPDAPRPVHPGFYHKPVHPGDLLQRLPVHTGYDFYDGFQAVYLISRVDPLRRIADLKIHAALKP